MGVRSAAAGDEAEVFDLALALASSFVPRAPTFARTYRALLADPSCALLVVGAPGSVEGYLLGFEHRTFYADGPVSWVEELSVRADRRGLGRGRLLMAAFERRGAERGSRLVALATRRAGAFYSALGYEASATYYRRVLPDAAYPPPPGGATGRRPGSAGTPGRW